MTYRNNECQYNSLFHIFDSLYWVYVAATEASASFHNFQSFCKKPVKPYGYVKPYSWKARTWEMLA